MHPPSHVEEVQDHSSDLSITEAGEAYNKPSAGCHYALMVFLPTGQTAVYYVCGICNAFMTCAFILVKEKHK